MLHARAGGAPACAGPAASSPRPRCPNLRCPPAAALSQPEESALYSADPLSLLAQRLRDEVANEKAKSARMELLLRAEREEAMAGARAVREEAARKCAALEASLLAERRASLEASKQARALVADARREAQTALLRERQLHTAATAQQLRDMQAAVDEKSRQLDCERQRVKELESVAREQRFSSYDLVAQSERLASLRRGAARALRGELEEAEEEAQPELSGPSSATLLREALARESAALVEASAARAQADELLEQLSEALRSVEEERELRLAAEDVLIQLHEDSKFEEEATF